MVKLAYAVLRLIWVPNSSEAGIRGNLWHMGVRARDSVRMGHDVYLWGLVCLCPEGVGEVLWQKVSAITQSSTNNCMFFF